MTYLRELKQKPWFGEYKLCRMPETLAPYPNISAFHLLEMAAEKYPDAGVVQLGTKLRYAQILGQSRRLAAALCGLGVKKGDRVATILPTSIQFVISDYGISRAGAVHLPSSFLEPESVLEHKFAEASPKALIFMADDEGKNLAQAQSLAARAGIKNIIVTRTKDYSAVRPGHERIENVLWLTELAENHPENPPEISCDPDRDLETLLFTGGTTGLPKGCMLTHKNVVANALQSAAAFGPLADLLGGKFAVLIGIPFFHSYGHSIMHTVTYLGASQLLVIDPRDTANLISMIRKYYPILQFGVPMQYMKMLREELDGVNILGVSGSAALPVEVQEQFEKRGRGGVLEGYGLSECSPNTHLNPSLTIRLSGGREKTWLNAKLDEYYPLLKKALSPVRKHVDAKIVGKVFTSLLPWMIKRANEPDRKKDEKKGSIGIPFLDTEIKVVDDEGRELTLEELLSGKSGEMLVNGPQRMLGYWPEPGSGMDADGFVATGDVVRMDGNGYFYVVDRKKDMINVSGYKVYSREIDDLLCTHAAVELAAAIGVPDPERPGSERVKVFIQLKPGFKGKVSAEDFKAFLQDKLAKYAQPREIELVDEIPLTSIGKIDKKALRDGLARG